MYVSRGERRADRDGAARQNSAQPDVAESDTAAGVGSAEARPPSARRAASPDAPRITGQSGDSDGSDSDLSDGSARPAESVEGVDQPADSRRARRAGKSRDKSKRGRCDAFLVVVVYAFCTFLLLPSIDIWLGVWTCGFPFGGITRAGPGAACVEGTCWHAAHLVALAMSVVFLAATAAIVVLGFAFVMRMDERSPSAATLKMVDEQVRAARLASLRGAGEATRQSELAKPVHRAERCAILDAATTEAVAPEFSPELRALARRAGLRKGAGKGPGRSSAVAPEPERGSSDGGSGSESDWDSDGDRARASADGVNQQASARKGSERRAADAPRPSGSSQGSDVANREPGRGSVASRRQMSKSKTASDGALAVRGKRRSRRVANASVELQHALASVNTLEVQLSPAFLAVLVASKFAAAWASVVLSRRSVEAAIVVAALAATLVAYWATWRGVAQRSFGRLSFLAGIAYTLAACTAWLVLVLRLTVATHLGELDLLGNLPAPDIADESSMGDPIVIVAGIAWVILALVSLLFWFTEDSKRTGGLPLFRRSGHAEELLRSLAAHAATRVSNRRSVGSDKALEDSAEAQVRGALVGMATESDSDSDGEADAGASSAQPAEADLEATEMIRRAIMDAENAARNDDDELDRDSVTQAEPRVSQPGRPDLHFGLAARSASSDEGLQVRPIAPGEPGSGLSRDESMESMDADDVAEIAPPSTKGPRGMSTVVTAADRPDAQDDAARRRFGRGSASGLVLGSDDTRGLDLQDGSPTRSPEDEALGSPHAPARTSHRVRHSDSARPLSANTKQRSRDALTAAPLSVEQRRPFARSSPLKLYGDPMGPAAGGAQGLAATGSLPPLAAAEPRAPGVGLNALEALRLAARMPTRGSSTSESHSRKSVAGQLIKMSLDDGSSRDSSEPEDEPEDEMDVVTRAVLEAGTAAGSAGSASPRQSAAGSLLGFDPQELPETGMHSTARPRRPSQLAAPHVPAAVNEGDEDAGDGSESGSEVAGETEAPGAQAAARVPFRRSQPPALPGHGAGPGASAAAGTLVGTHGAAFGSLPASGDLSSDDGSDDDDGIHYLHAEDERGRRRESVAGDQLDAVARAVAGASLAQEDSRSVASDDSEQHPGLRG
ncbi:hypothetical protein FNF27_04343 [Cafeteria roenbergensis]|uniref:Uncharacterized protein n=1 Tax=Cafeteria roenbergensis TaxID=33653 RepID=A0A5A8E8Q1_CAFRO|nr:hypothetical protein FNF27_04343 [Cafeteria roenbergensis]